MTSNTIQVGEIIKKRRERLRISLRTLATESGFSPSFISQVENGQASPSIASLQKIAACLDATLADFFVTNDPRPVAVVRKSERLRIESNWSKADIEALSRGIKGDIEPILITIQPGGTSGKAPHALNDDQFVFIVFGTVVLGQENSEQTLEAGDSVTISRRSAIRWTNASDAPAQLLVITRHVI
jgi:transcriptional regulator with XRE-family HTH domain